MKERQTATLLAPALTSLQSQIERQIAGIKDFVGSLNEAIDNSTALKVYCAKIPQVDVEEVTTDIDVIAVESCDSPLTTITEIKRSFGDFHVHEGKKSKLVFRLPGVVQLPLDSSAHITEITDAINAKKMEFASLCKSSVLADRNVKELFFRELFPFLVKTQVTRKIRTVFDPHVSLLNFHWTDKPISSRITKKEVMQRISDFEMSHSGSSELSSRAQQKQVAMDMLKARMLALPDSAELRIRRPIRTQPAVTVVSSKINNFTAPLPFLLFNDNPNVKLTELGKYVAKPTSTLHEGYKCLSSNMNLFLKLK
ncbi:DNA replication terminus site-binding protein [Shewanella colwelliana]|uniref:DNA replication terminus site-binding protein n=1 Tax=Shewanella colwelliana TaxID=23 RepID=UPI0022AF0204|nr:DNA replication terminus site-binding protein [Shewanella colwelliana]MCZ4337743.1 DNA replication terminus site-binding protein [Shewanella colwelliana]